MPTISGFAAPIGHAVIAGKVTGEHAVPGNLKPGDTLLAAVHITPGTPPTRVDRTAEFSVSATKAGVVSNTGGTNTTGGFILLAWSKTE
jgi:hypothetical protein